MFVLRNRIDPELS